MAMQHMLVSSAFACPLLPNYNVACNAALDGRMQIFAASAICANSLVRLPCCNEMQDFKQDWPVEDDHLHENRSMHFCLLAMSLLPCSTVTMEMCRQS